MTLHSLYLWLYCLPVYQALSLWGAGCAVAILLRNHLSNLRCWRWLCGALTVAWAAAVIHLTLLSRTPDPGLENALKLFDSYRVWLREGNREMPRSILMNLGLFLPGGLLLIQLMPRRLCWWKRLVPALTVMLLFSLAIEWSQFHWQLGRLEADDVLHNTLGSLLGILGDILLPLKPTDT